MMIVNPNIPAQGGVSSFNGRSGDVKPAQGDYTAAQVGAVPTTRTVNGKALSGDISLTAADVGALAAGGIASSASKLATARAIDGVSFNGSAAITHYGTCSTAAATSAKVVSLTGFSLVTGARVAVKFTYANDAANPTLNVNSTGAKAIYYADGKVGRRGIWGAGRIVEFVYDGTNWLMVNPTFAENNCTASGSFSHAEGANTTASGAGGSHAEGNNTTASGPSAHAEGNGCVASGNWSFAGGNSSEAKIDTAFAFGDHAIAMGGQFAIGKYNKALGESNNTLIIGYGTDAARANAFRVYTVGTATSVYSGTYHSNGADYAEFFEWADGNTAQEDRTGHFVTLDGDKIRLADPTDDYVIGVVSGSPSVVGDSYDDQWKGMFLTDVFGRPTVECVEVPAELGPDGEVLLPAHTEHRQKLNPDYDHEEPYLPRSQRPEWDAVGLLGKLVAVDDGSCQVNGWCRVGEGGVATASEERTRYRVMARLDENHVRVMIL